MRGVQISRVLDRVLRVCRAINDFLEEHGPDQTFLFNTCGYPECIITPIFMRFWLLNHREGFELPKGGGFDRVLHCKEAYPPIPRRNRSQRNGS